MCHANVALNEKLNYEADNAACTHARTRLRSPTASANHSESLGKCCFLSERHLLASCLSAPAHRPLTKQEAECQRFVNKNTECRQPSANLRLRKQKALSELTTCCCCCCCLGCCCLCCTAAPAPSGPSHCKCFHTTPSEPAACSLSVTRVLSHRLHPVTPQSMIRGAQVSRHLTFEAAEDI